MHPKTAEAGCPALPTQRGMIFNGLRFPDAGIDVVQCVIHWPGLDVAAYRAAWERAVTRHPALRTGFVLAGDAEPVQAEWPDATLDFTVRTDSVTDFLAEDRARGFAFDVPPLVRVTVLTLATPTIVITSHNAVLDDRSLAMLIAELDSDYEGRPDFPARTSHRAYVEWYAAGEQDRVFWTPGVSGPTPLPFGKVADGAGQASQNVGFTMTDEETVALQQLADSESVTLGTIVLAAWALVLGTHASTDDAVFGVTRSARHGSVPGADSIVGSALATSPMRVRLDRSLSVGEWLRQIRRDAVAVRDHQPGPLSDLQRYMGLIFEQQDLHTLLRKGNPVWDEREIEVHRRPGHPLTVHAVAEPTLHVALIHDRFTAAEADVLTGHLRVALLRLADGPHGRVGDLSLLSSDEHTLLTSGGHTDPLAYPRERTIPDLFDEQVRRAPDADAVFDGAKWLSYAELEDRATRIAAALRDRGIGVEEPVAVALPRGADLIAAFLGVLKVGAAYLPVDAAHPPARNAMMLADSGARVVIADGGDWPADVLSIDDLPVAAPFPCPARADTLAYLNYTSGSTGRPKGVAVPHRGVVRLVHEPNFATVGPGQTFLFAASPSFDATTFELWGALLTGARVVPVPPGPLDAPDLAKLIDRHGVTLLWLTAGLFHQFVEHDVAALSEVDQLLAGGDALAPDAVRAALAARGGKPVTNGYGPTENTTFTSCHVMHAPDDVGATTPIGRPVQHTTVYVLDQDMRPVPVGAVGELYSGGDGVARGYLHRPALTAAKFVPDPFGPPGARLYRTGDRARWRADGTLEFLGRVDSQVKVRGYLVEPGETESVLRTHPQVVDAAVVVHGANDLRRLVAYVTPAELDLASVRAHVATALPEFLRPASYQALPRLPLTANGKVDRAALPAPTAAGSAGSARLPLTGDAQHRMAGIWRALLGVDEVGAGDEFFELGGNSLLATRLTFRIRETFGVELPIREIYRAPTLADLTEAVAAAKKPTTAGIVRRDRRAYRAAESADAPDRHRALRPRVESRGAGFGVEPLPPDGAAAAARLLAAEQEFAARRDAALDQIDALRRWVESRGAGGGVEQPLDLPSPDGAAAAARLLAAEQEFAARRDAALDQIDALRQWVESRGAGGGVEPLPPNGAANDARVSAAKQDFAAHRDAALDQIDALRQWVESRGAGGGVEPLPPNGAANDARVSAAEQDFAAHQDTALDQIEALRQWVQSRNAGVGMGPLPPEGAAATARVLAAEQEIAAHRDTALDHIDALRQWVETRDAALGMEPPPPDGAADDARALAAEQDFAARRDAALDQIEALRQWVETRHAGGGVEPLPPGGAGAAAPVRAAEQALGQLDALRRWVESRGVRFGVELPLDLASSDGAAAAAGVLAAEQEFVARRDVALDQVEELMATGAAGAVSALREVAELIREARLSGLDPSGSVRQYTAALVEAGAALSEALAVYATAFSSEMSHTAEFRFVAVERRGPAPEGQS